ncbi:MAG: DMT family transporter [Gemmatimonadaceae bacterium]
MTDAPAPPWRATLLVLLAACGFGSISVLLVVGGRQGLTLAPAMAWRYGLAAPFLMLVAGRELRAVSPRRMAALVVIGGLGQVAISATSLSALRWLDVATLGFLFYTYPAWVTLFSAVRGLERISGRKLMALALALGGIAVIVGAPRASALPTPGVLLALGSAVLYALYIPLLHRLRGPLSAAAASAYVIAGAGAAFIIAAAWLGTLSASLPAASWAVIAALALGCTVMPFIAFLNGLARLGAVRTAIISTFEPFYTTVVGALVLGQRAGPGTLAGGVLIATAVLLLQREPSST